MPEAKVPGVGHTVAQHPKDDLGAGTMVKTANGEVKSGQQVYEEGRSQAQGMKGNGVGAVQEQINDIRPCVCTKEDASSADIEFKYSRIALI